ncbi:ferrochelatase [Cellulomonas fimi ATCC 484]|uniref:Coproporphyrin III ferrochelatase n=1 Tax=Cellulomonas fimi (strain ATCC 484 / DSM 20113 / JCM 1341 / CCUG 24087 / LMG 16345 / NBRC 15513 / NCIMB 8980 / NCTC 7547 / NRS-133) TaxID=590998 RepID=F4H463_CELFA|nr:ferrochelatase [Cellulomonas fimi ATCC 484]VEH29320.1 Ferrochelatase [Cellulomonas fimi]
MRCDDRTVAPDTPLSTPAPAAGPADSPRPADAENPVAPYDALLLFSFGGPNGPDDVMPFLRNVTAGKGIPDERLAEVAEHYHHFGGASPINAQNLALQKALQDELARRGLDLPVLWGNRNWEPYTRDALAAAHADGARRIVALVTSAYASYSGCRQYRENLWASLDELGGDLGLAEGTHPLAADKVRPYFNHPGFVQANVDAVAEAYAGLAADAAAQARLVFVTHSIPDTMEEASAVSGAAYSAQHLDVAATVAAAVSERLGRDVAWDLAYCSRSGPPSQPWLEPDVNDHLRALAEQGVTSVVLSPIGFISDHMEVAFDLDTEALETAAELGLTAVRADSVGTREPFVRGLVDLVLERAALARALDAGTADASTAEGAAVGDLPPWRDVCRPGCCRQRAGVASGIPAACSTDPWS